VGIGCGVLLLLGLLGMMAAGMFVAKKAGEFVEQAGDNPALAAAEMAVKLNPELELVETDREAGTLKVRNKETGEVYIFDAKDINEGKFSIGKEGEETTVTFGSEGEEAGLTVQGPGGETFRAGAARPEDLPEWVPVIPGGTPTGGFASSSGESASGTVVVTSEEPFDDVLAFYEQELTDAGFEVEKTTFSGAGTRGASLQGTTEDGSRSLTVGLNETESTTQIMLTYEEKNP
jgi:hypothetical protein